MKTLLSAFMLLLCLQSFAKVIKKFLCLHLVHYDDYDSEWDEWVGYGKIEKM